jgi:hypothetical protein
LILFIALLAICPVAADEVAVTVNGKPLADGTIVFTLDDDEFVGTRIKGGSYKVTRVPAGRWRVTIRSNEVPAKYGSEDTSAFKVAVQPGLNVMDFDVKKK